MAYKVSGRTVKGTKVKVAHWHWILLASGHGARRADISLTLAPRLINREAATYINVSPGTLDEMVKSGTMRQLRQFTAKRTAGIFATLISV